MKAPAKSKFEINEDDLNWEDDAKRGKGKKKQLAKPAQQEPPQTSQSKKETKKDAKKAQKQPEV